MQKFINFLHNPLAILLGIFFAVIIAIFFKPLIPFISPLGDFYVSLLQMMVIPIIISAIFLSVGKLIKNKSANYYFKKIIITFTLVLISTACLAIILGLIGQPGKLNSENYEKIGQIILKYEKPDSNLLITQNENDYSLTKIFLTLIPENIFSSLTEGKVLEITLFFLIFALALKNIPDNTSNTFLALAEGIFLASQSIIKFFLTFLPFAIIVLVSKQLANLGFGIFFILFKFIIFFLIGILILIFVITIIYKIVFRTSFFKPFILLKDALITAFCIRHAMATLPIALNALKNQKKINLDALYLVTPLCFTLQKITETFTFAFSTIFCLQLFNFTINLPIIISIIFLSILTALSTIGMPSLILYMMISIVFIPLNLPFGIIIILLIILDPIIDPIATFTNVYLNSLISSIIVKEKEI